MEVLAFTWLNFQENSMFYPKDVCGRIVDPVFSAYGGGLLYSLHVLRIISIIPQKMLLIIDKKDNHYLNRLKL